MFFCATSEGPYKIDLLSCGLGASVWCSLLSFTLCHSALSLSLSLSSAKVLVPGEPNVSYICSRYYRAPELVFEATQYTTQIESVYKRHKMIGQTIEVQ